ncbi:unnamed protein product [Caenorhabditis bovis]|uniref:C-type lectin domain-containing protein n=1 Tax=Caenorhabditis bovis TaxID=2654633 RepID=A0A8S1EVA9_9PELO|nr:unnamed protein product [Caenorhabditis bovis]
MTKYLRFVLITIIMMAAECQLPSCADAICPEKFTKFTRASGRAFCLRVVGNLSVNYYQAQKHCNSLHPFAKLFGIASEAEYDFVIAQTGEMRHYVGAFRNPLCHQNKTELEKRVECTVDKV